MIPLSNRQFSLFPERFLLLLAVLFALFAQDIATAAEFAPTAPDRGFAREQHLLIPSSVPGLLMHSRLLLPAGKGPFPLAVISHGSEQAAVPRKRMQAPSFPGLTRWLVERGYAVVLPLRPGHGATGGRYLENQGPCFAANFQAAGTGTASSILAVIRYMQAQDYVDPKRVIAIGNSAGGWGTIALASQNVPGLIAAINFAGGLGGRNGNKPNNNCSPDRLVEAAGQYGRTTRVPTLWLYSENDTYFPPQLSKRMAAAFGNSGGKVQYELLPPVAGDGHALINDLPAWSVLLDRFLKQL